MSPAPAPPRTVVPRLGCGYAICAVLVAAGGTLLCLSSARWQAGATAAAWWLGGLGAGCCLLALGLIGPMQRDVAAKRERLARETSEPHAPWTWEPAWMDRGGIVQAGRRHGGALTFIGVMFVLVGLPGVFVALPRELSSRNPAAALILLFPLVGLGLLVAAARDAWRRRKYGVARFVPAAVPFPLGGEVAGVVVVDRSLLPNGTGRVALDCWCARRTNDSDTNETALAHVEREIAPRDWEVRSASSRLRVQLPLRGGAPTTMGAPVAGGSTYEWRLRVSTPTPGADFLAEFVLPVFDVGVPAAAELATRTVGNAKQRRAEIWRAAGIREEPQFAAVGGRALVFPAGAGRSALGWPLLMAAIVGAVAVVLWLSPAPRFIPLVAAIFPALLTLACVTLWRGGGERVWVERDALCSQRANGPLRHVPLAEFAKFERSVAAGVGTRQFHRLAARQRPDLPGRFGKVFPLASLVPGEEAATETVAWLEERMADADGKATSPRRT